MAGERQLLARGEDPQPVVRLVGLQEEGGLRKVGPPGDALHLRGVERLGVDDDRHRVAEERLGSEDIDLLEAQSFHGAIIARADHLAGHIQEPGSVELRVD
jgi:hypothetical protein